MNYFVPLIIHGHGLREHNEDTFRYGMVNEDTSFYTVCDGVGGAQKGVVASMLACDVVADYLKAHSYYSSSLDHEQCIKQIDNGIILLDSSVPDTEKTEEIKKRCVHFSKDNYTALLVPIL